MIKKAVLPLILLTLTASVALAATEGFDRADDPAYDDAWTDGDDGGTPATFNPWSLQTSGTGTLGFVIESSTTGGGANINSSGEAFGMYAVGGGNFVDAFRSFDVALQPGQVFSFDLSVRFRNGNKGFNLRAGDTSIFNLNIGNDAYVVSNAETGNGALFGNEYSDNTVFSIQFTQTDQTSGSWTVTRSGGVTGTANGTYSGTPNNFQFYVGQTGGGAENNLYFNNLAVTAIPEPSTVSLLGASAVFAGCFYARRRRR